MTGPRSVAAARCGDNGASHNFMLIRPRGLWLNQNRVWSNTVIDPDGYRPNVGIILMRDDGSVFWARRAFRDGWQFPQGGMRSDETPLEAMYRELEEETGLSPQHVEVLAATRAGLLYNRPSRYIRHHQQPTCIGQKQVWFLLKLVGGEDALRLDACDKPEF